jgi:hypothetical protein
MSPRLETLRDDPGPTEREERTKRPLLSLWSRDARSCRPAAGLELGAYRMGEDSDSN